MFLFELEDPEVVKFTARISQLKHDVDIGKIDPNNYTKEELLDYFSKNDTILPDGDDLFDMIKHPPLNNVISNIQGDKVVFKGHDEVDQPDQPESQQVVQQMAQNAMPTK